MERGDNIPPAKTNGINMNQFLFCWSHSPRKHKICTKQAKRSTKPSRDTWKRGSRRASGASGRMAATEAVAASPWIVAAAVGFGLYIGYGLGQVDKDSNFSGDGSLWERISPQVLVRGLQKIGFHIVDKSMDMDSSRPTGAVESSAAVESNESSVGTSRPQSPPGRPNAPVRSTAKHVAIIMDGNRRYGTARHGNALQGHADGGQTLVDCVQWCLEAGVGALTVYAFSTENWARPPAEVDLLMSIFIKYAARCEEEALKNNLVRIFSFLPH